MRQACFGSGAKPELVRQEARLRLPENSHLTMTTSGSLPEASGGLTDTMGSQWLSSMSSGPNTSLVLPCSFDYWIDTLYGSNLRVDSLNGLPLSYSLHPMSLQTPVSRPEDSTGQRTFPSLIAELRESTNSNIRLTTPSAQTSLAMLHPEYDVLNSPLWCPETVRSIEFENDLEKLFPDWSCHPDWDWDQVEFSD